MVGAAAAAAKLLQLCPTLCDPIDSSPPGSAVPGILQARTLEWVAISFSNAWKWSCSVVSDPQRPQGLQPSRLLHPWDFPGKSTGVGCHCLLLVRCYFMLKILQEYQDIIFDLKCSLRITYHNHIFSWWRNWVNCWRLWNYWWQN